MPTIRTCPPQQGGEPIHKQSAIRILEAMHVPLDPTDVLADICPGEKRVFTSLELGGLTIQVIAFEWTNWKADSFFGPRFEFHFESLAALELSRVAAHLWAHLGPEFPTIGNGNHLPLPIVSLALEFVRAAMSP
jgi:hypothetical protein